MIGLHHLIIGLAFLIGAVLIDFDHLDDCNFKEMFIGVFGPVDCGGDGKSFMHKPLVYLSVTAVWLGYTIHLIADKLG